MFSLSVNLSNRHIHVSADDFAVLFGADATLTKKTDLMQPGQFAANETVSITGPRGTLENVRIVGPARSETQCEILFGDTYKLGFAPNTVPIRLSGDIADTPGFTITGPNGTLEKSSGLIIAQRHIHISPDEAAQYNLTDGQSLNLICETPVKRTVFADVIARVSADAVLECHIDLEEGNAAGIVNGYVASVEY